MPLTTEEIQQIANAVQEGVKKAIQGGEGASIAGISGITDTKVLARLKEYNDILKEVEEKHKNIVTFGSEEISNARQIIREKQKEISSIEENIRKTGILTDSEKEQLKNSQEKICLKTFVKKLR